MEQVGLVKKVSKGRAEVEVRRMSGCGENCKGCSSGCNTPNHIVVLPNNIDAKVGDLVEIKGETKSILKYTMVVYMIPFTMLILGIVIGMNIFKGLNMSNYEPLSFLTGLVAMALGYFIVKIIDKRISKTEDIIRMTRII